ncbi:HipA domain-containing protein [Pseudomonas sp. NPDC007930]|uniref:type II toxin-antitoxin system HipA family toxin n=1 Tax=Pseudomonas sp. NPDC007930 TaxID=3364417 RepID=UPI0036DFB2ED
MPERIEVYYQGWGEHWKWGTLAASAAVNGRPLIAFEYSDKARQRQLELAAYTLPLIGPSLRTGFPAHQLGLPGPVYDSLPDGWGMLLMDRLFKRRGLNPARIGPLQRLAYVGHHAMGALAFEPAAPEFDQPSAAIPLAQLAAEVQEVQRGEGGEFLQRLLQMGGSPQGARPKALVYRDASGAFSTQPSASAEAWLIKFPAQHEHPEVCAIEAAYAEGLRQCGICTPATVHFDLPAGQAAFATQRFDRQGELRVPMQSLAAFTGADYQTPGALDYTTFLRATQLCTQDARQKAAAFKRVVFNVVFNNRDDHPKNFAYLMKANGQWALAPAFDVTFCEGPGGYHQMDVMGEALRITRKQLAQLGQLEAELPLAEVHRIIEQVCEAGSQFAATAQRLLPGRITLTTLQTIAERIDSNIRELR